MKKKTAATPPDPEPTPPVENATGVDAEVQQLETHNKILSNLMAKAAADKNWKEFRANQRSYAQNTERIARLRRGPPRIGREPTDPAIVARGLELAKRMRIEDAAKAVGLGKDTLYRARAALHPGPVVSEGAPEAELEAITLDELDDVGIIDRLILKTREHIERMHLRIEKGVPGAAHGLATSQRGLADLVKLRRELEPPKENEDDREAKWKAAATRVVQKIEEGVKAAEARRVNGAGA